MNSSDRPLSFRRFFTAFLLFLGWCAQIIPLAAFTAPAEWKFETRQNASSEWWQTLSIQTVPGVVYHLQKSSTLDSGDWTNIVTTYGTGGEWVCPIFPGSAPSVAPPAGTPTLPATSVTPLNLAFLVLEKTTTGGTLISWSSLDDHTSRREILAGVTLDPTWDDFDAGYIEQHGNYIFGISPRLATPVTFTTGSTTLGPLDTGMVAAFTAALPTITANIQNSVARAANYNPQQENTGEKAFYRFSTDWNMDSDGDGRFDWQEIIIDGNNPFASDSDGDGTPDQTANPDSFGGGNGADDYPTPMDAQEPTPAARIQCQQFGVSRDSYDGLYKVEEGAPDIPVHTEHANGGYDGLDETSIRALDSVSTFHSFRAAVNQLPPPSVWSDNVDPFVSGCHTHFYTESEAEWEYGRHVKTDYFQYSRSRFRLKLDAPAPAGGYRIPVRIATIRETREYMGPSVLLPVAQSGTLYQEIMLECAEGQTEGTPVEFNGAENLPMNQQIVCIPAFVNLRTADEVDSEGNRVLFSGNAPRDGLCVKQYEPFVAVLSEHASISSLLPSDSPKVVIFWNEKKLKGNGLFEPPARMTTGPKIFPEADNAYSTITHSTSGVFQLDAIIHLENGLEIEVPYVRMQNARSIQDGSPEPQINELLKAGTLDFFGVSSNQTSLDIRNKAVTFLGSTRYSFDKQMEVDFDNLFNPTMKDRNKCTIFVTHISRSVGATTPYYYTYWVSPHAPRARQDWYSSPGEDIQLEPYGWKYGDTDSGIEPGRVIAGYGIGHDSGHAGILDYDGTWIGTGSKTVNKFISLQNMDAHYRPYSIRYR